MSVSKQREPAPPDPATLAAELLERPRAQQRAWIAAHHEYVNIQLVAALKTYGDEHALSRPQAADAATRCALRVAEYCRDTSLAGSLAAWARGNWQIYHNPRRALRWYRRALAGYRRAGDALSVARLLSNMVFPYAECGYLAEGEAAANEARALLIGIGEPAAFYLMALEQHAGWLLHTQGRYADALAAYDRALALADRLGQPTNAAEIQVNRTLTLKIVGLRAEEERMLIESRSVAEAHGHLLTVARIDMNLGELYAAQGRPMEALRRLQAARDRFAALENQMELSTVLRIEAGVLSRIGALRDARRSYAQAQANFASLGLQPQVGVALVRGAAASRKDGAFVQAAQSLAQAEALWRALDQPLWRTIVRFEYAELALAQGDADRAITLARAPLPAGDSPELSAQRDVLLADALALRRRAHGDEAAVHEAQHAYAQALRYADQKEDRWLQRRALAGLGRLAFPHDPATCRAHLEAAVAHDDAMRQMLSAEELKAGFQTHASDLLPILVRLAAAQDQPAQALALAWRAKGGGLLDILRSSGDERLPPNLRANLDHVRRQLASQRWIRALEAPADAPEQLWERDDATIRDLENQLYALRRQTQQALNEPARPDDPLRLVAQMDADLLIEYVRCGDELLAVRADRDGSCRAVWLGSVAGALDLLDELQLQFQHALTQPAQRRIQRHDDWMAACRPLLHHGYTTLIAPLGPLPAEAHVLIAPCDPLYLLPFAALWETDHYLVERYTIELIPSGALLAAPPRAAPAGAPLILAASAGGRLGGVRAEAANVQAALPGAVCLIDDPRSLARLQTLEAAPLILHIAAHSILREDAPIFSALQLAGGMLSVEQCYDLPLSGTALVTLSGCTTATGLDTGGSLLAFQSAFFAAGARAVVSSLWLIDDQAAAAWMEQFYRLLVAGRAPAAALRQTQLALLVASPYRHPAIWAAFTSSRR